MKTLLAIFMALFFSGCIGEYIFEITNGVELVKSVASKNTNHSIKYKMASAAKIAYDVVRDSELSKEKYDEFWDLMKNPKLKRAYKDYIKNEVKPLAILNVQYLQSAVLSYENNQTILTPELKSYKEKGIQLIHSGYYDSIDNSTRKRLKEILQIYLTNVEKAKNEGILKLYLPDTMLGENGLIYEEKEIRIPTRYYYRLELEKQQNAVKLIDILFTKNYKGDFKIN